MRSIIESFYNGELYPGERIAKIYKEEFWKECRKAGEVERTLCDGLGEKERKLFEEYKLLVQKSGYLEIRDNFAYGISLGMMMAAEAYKTVDQV